MNAKWRCFLAAVIPAAYLVLAGGAPPVAVAVGVGGAALWMLRRSRTA